jgi:hypothetical protein
MCSPCKAERYRQSVSPQSVAALPSLAVAVLPRKLMSQPSPPLLPRWRTLPTRQRCLCKARVSQGSIQERAATTDIQAALTCFLPHHHGDHQGKHGGVREGDDPKEQYP